MKLYLILSSLLVFLASAASTAYAETPTNYEALCEGHTIGLLNPPLLDTLINIFANLDMAVNVDRDNDGSVDAKLLCFDNSNYFGQYGFPGTLKVGGLSGKTLIVYNLGISLAVDGQIAVDDNVIFDHLNISGKSLNPISISGDNISIIESEIKSKMIGIFINNSNNIRIENSILRGPGGWSSSVAESIGVKIENSHDVVITGPRDWRDNTIKDFETGVDGPANIGNISYKYTSVPIKYGNFTIDVSSVGRAAPASNLVGVADIIGLAPMLSCGEVETNNGAVSMYSRTMDILIFYWSSCIIKPSNIELCLKPSSPNTDNSANANECTVTIHKGQCIFVCDDISLSYSMSAQFSYKNAHGISHTFSDPIITGMLPVVSATLAPAVPVTAGPQISADVTDMSDSSNFSETTTVDVPADDDSDTTDSERNKMDSSSIEQGGPNIDSPKTLLGSDGMKVSGCSLLIMNHNDSRFGSGN